MSPMALHTTLERWPLITPFRITGYIWEAIDVLIVSLSRDGQVGHGEAAGVYFNNDKPASMIRQVEAIRSRIEAGLTREALQQLLAPGGARNAVDCALWDLEAKTTGRPAWAAAELDTPRPLITTFGCGADTPEAMAALAESYRDARAIKLKLTGEPVDADRVRAVREVRPEVWLGIDVPIKASRDRL
jgi:L-alanine-DL-glutamate epimerase-like enolase superfamily enzyme